MSGFPEDVQKFFDDSRKKLVADKEHGGAYEEDVGYGEYQLYNGYVFPKGVSKK